jgi:hypothetical protein
MFVIAKGEVARVVDDAFVDGPEGPEGIVPASLHKVKRDFSGEAEIRRTVCLVVRQTRDGLRCVEITASLWLTGWCELTYLMFGWVAVGDIL